jgi:mono/diheme cytochrome c family protein
MDMSPAANRQRAAKLYGLLCTQCHGADGVRHAAGAGAQRPDLPEPDCPTPRSSRSSPAACSGTSMPAWGGYLTEADIAAITAYLRNMEANGAGNGCAISSS